MSAADVSAYHEIRMLNAADLVGMADFVNREVSPVQVTEAEHPHRLRQRQQALSAEEEEKAVEKAVASLATLKARI